MKMSCLALLMIVLSTGCNANKNESSKGMNAKDTYPVAQYTKANNLGKYSMAIFAGGCFWCTEAVFERIDGVKDVISGYSGGRKDYPSYNEVGAGTTGHAEAIFIYYDASKVNYETLLDVFFVAHDPTTLNRQGPDVGEAYRSAIYYQTQDELIQIKKTIEKVNASGNYDNKVVTQIEPYKEFWVAESYHQNYYELNPRHSYVYNVSRPKVEKVLHKFPELIKNKYKG